MANKPLTQDQLAKVEEKLKTYMANKQSWVKRYGKDAENVMRGRAISTVKKETEKMNKQKIKELVKTSLMKEVSNSEIESSVKNMISNSEYDMDDFKISSDNPNKVELRYQYYSRLPEDLRSSLENEFDVVENELEDEDTLPQYSYIISSKMNEAKKKSFPDLTGDGKVTKADILKGRGVELDEAEKPSMFVSGGNINPELRKKVEQFVKGVAKYYDYSVDDAYFAIMSILKGGLAKEGVNEADVLKDKGIKLNEDGGTLKVEKEKDGKYYWTFTFKSGKFERWPDGFNTSAEAKKDFMYRSKYLKEPLGEDLDLGHQDNEPHMIKGELYRIGKYAMELYQMVDGFEGPGEVDFPAWWQSKITTSMNNMVSAKHYLDFELKEPTIDAMVGVASDEEVIDENKIKMYYHVLEDGGYGRIGHQGYYNTKEEAEKRADKLSDMFPRSSFYVEAYPSKKEPVTVTMEESKIDKVDILSRELYKLKGKIQPAFFDKIRKFINMGSLEDAEYLLNRVKGQMKEKDLNEKKLTSAEKKKKEEIVKGMKDSFKGDKEAMYAIATDKAKKVAETIAKKLKENVGLKKGDTVEYEGNKYKIGSFDTEANLVYLNTMNGKPAEDRKGDYLQVNATRVKN